MTRLTYVCPLAVAVVLAAATWSHSIAGPVEDEIPSAASQLAKAYKNLLKAKSYAVDTSVLGGLSNKDDHEVVTTTVSESYGGSIFGSSRAPIMHIPSLKAYKMPKAGKGVISSSGAWVRILSTPTGVKMDRLIDFPTLILGEAMRYARSARWLEDDELDDYFKTVSSGSSGSSDILDFEELEAEIAEESDGSDEDGEIRKGKTYVEGGEVEEASETKVPRVLRVTADPKQALSIWVKRVENSGCMKEG